MNKFIKETPNFFLRFDLLVLCVLLLLTIISCIGSKSPSINLEVEAEGILSEDSTIEYRDKNGELQIESLTEGTWEKQFPFPEGSFNVFLKVTGVLTGDISISASGSSKSSSFSESDSTGSSESAPFELTIDRTIE